MKRLGFVIVFLLFSQLVFSGQAKQASVDLESPAVKSVLKLTKYQFSPIKTFPAADHLVGIMLQAKNKQNPGPPFLLFAEASGKYVIDGNIFDSKGNDLSQKYADEYLKPYTAKLILAGLPNTHAFVSGDAKAPYEMYVVADPNCSACHYFYTHVKPLLSDGTLRIHWILVSFIKQDGDKKVAAIWDAPSSADAMSYNADHFDRQHEVGGMKNVDVVSEKDAKALQDNMNFIRNAGIMKTPTLIFYAGGKLQFIEGVPGQLEAFVKTVKPSIHQTKTVADKS